MSLLWWDTDKLLKMLKCKQEEKISKHYNISYKNELYENNVDMYLLFIDVNNLIVKIQNERLTSLGFDIKH